MHGLGVSSNRRMRTPSVLWLLVSLSVLSACQGTSTGDLPKASPAVPPVDLSHALVPIVPGLEIVTAVEDVGDDYESFKTILESDPQRYRFSYSSLSRSDMQLHRAHSERDVSTADHVNAAQYRIAFNNGERGPVAGTTAISLSTAKFRELVGKGETRIDLVTTQGDMEGNPTPVVQSVDLKRDGGPIDFPVLVNNKMTRLPAIHALYRQNFDQALYPNTVDTEFHEGFTFLNDEVNPLALRWQFLLWTLEVIRINNVQVHLVKSDPPAGSSPPARDAPAILAQELEDGLAKRGVVEVPGIYFDTGSAVIRPESGPAIAAIAEALSRNAALKVSVEGHTDNQGGQQYNLDLSRARAEAVRKILIDKYAIDSGRMTTRGHGYAQPKADNSTLLGRSQNRRVELVRL